MRSGKPVMFDQCLKNLAIVARVVSSGAAHSLVIKPALLGGLTTGRSARDICIDANQRMRMDGPWSASISTAALLHLTVGAPSHLLIAGGDLRQKLKTINFWKGAPTSSNGTLELRDGVGHGVEPDLFSPALNGDHNAL